MPADTSFVGSDPDDVTLLDLITVVFRINQYPRTLPLYEFESAFHCFAPEYEKPFADVVAAGGGAGVKIIDKCENCGGEICDEGLDVSVALDDPLPPSQLHRLVKAISISYLRCLCPVEDTKGRCILSEDVNDLLRSFYDLHDKPDPVWAWDALEAHPLIDVFYVEGDKYYGLSTWDYRVIFKYFDEADEAAGALIGELGILGMEDLAEEMNLEHAAVEETFIEDALDAFFDIF